MKFILVIIISAALASSSQAQEWIPWSVPQGVPKYQAPRGNEANGSPLYIIRAAVGSDPSIPGKYNAEMFKAFVPSDGKEVLVPKFEFFIATNVKWIPASNGIIPANAVVGGAVQSGEKLYIGRGPYSGSLTPGKVQASRGGLVISYGGAERNISNYEQLVYA